MDRFSSTERIGVNKVEKIFLEDFSWIPRHVLQSDVGIDMEVEMCNDGRPSGQLIGVQIKSGESYFKTDSSGDIVYYGSLIHLDYWLKHSLPIILILHNPSTDITLWQKIEDSRISITKKRWKTEIPITQQLNKNNKTNLEKINKYPIYFQRLQRLAVHKKLMQDIKNGEKIILELEEWINKTIGRVSIILKRITNDDNEITLSEGMYIYFKGIEDLNILYPWADFRTDDDYYEDYDHDNFMSEYGIWDSEEKEYFGTTIDFDEYKSDLLKIRPIVTGSGEIHFYRLLVTLNNLGNSFLELNSFLENGKQLIINF